MPPLAMAARLPSVLDADAIAAVKTIRDFDTTSPRGRSASRRRWWAEARAVEWLAARLAPNEAGTG